MGNLLILCLLKKIKMNLKKQQLLDYLKQKGFSKKILQAFEKTNRTKFIPDIKKEVAYEDRPLSIGYCQTISQPYTIAFMLSLLKIKNNQKILEIGSGSGYVLELITKMSKNLQIFGVERLRPLVQLSKEKLNNIKEIKIIHANGSKGLPEEQPFDRILVSAECSEIPQELLGQLKPGGILVAPVRGSILQITKKNAKSKITEYPGFVFVPLVKDKV